MADIESNIDINIDTSSALANLKSLQSEISAFHQSMAKAGAVSNTQLANMQQNLVNSINATGNFSAQIRAVSTTTESFTNALEKNKLTMGEYFRYAGGASKTFGRAFRTEFDTIEKVARERVKTIQTQYVKLGRDASGAMKAISVRPLTLDLDDLGTKTAIAAQKAQLFNQLMAQGSTNLLNFGKNTQWAGRQLMVGFTVPLGIMGAAAAREFMKMEEQVIRFQRVYGDFATTASETDKMAESVKSLAGEFTKYGVAIEKTMGLAADAAAMGKTGADLLAQVTETTRLAVLGGVENDKALETTTSLTNAFGVSAEQLANKINFLNAVENQTVTSIADLTEAIPVAGPVIQQLGGDVEDLTFFLTAMREGGINANEGANALKSGLASMINPTGEASEMLAELGINLEGIVKANAGDVKGTVVQFAQALDTLDPLTRAQAIEQLFGKFQFARISTLFQNVTAQGSQAQKVLGIAAQTTEELAVLSQRELARVEASPMYKFQKAIEDFKASLAPVGEQFLKAVTPLVEFGTRILEGFNSWGEGAKNFAVIAVAAIAGIGPIALMSFGLLANGLANIIKLGMSLKNAFSGGANSSKVLGESLNYQTQEQLENAAIAASLNQIHNDLIQTFTSEAGAVRQLAGAYQQAVAAQSAMTGPITTRGGGTKRPRKYAKGGVVMVPGSGNRDTEAAMLTPGEAVIPKDMVKRYGSLINAMIAGTIPGYKTGKGATKRFDAPSDDTYDQAHYSGTKFMTGAELREWGKTQHSSVMASLNARLAEQERFLGSKEAVDAHRFQVYDNQVVNMGTLLNNLFKSSGTGGMAKIEDIQKEFKKSGPQAHGQAAAMLKKLGATDAEIKKTLQTVADNIDRELATFGKGVKLSGEQLDQVIQKAYADAAKGNTAAAKRLRAASAASASPTAFLTAQKNVNTRVAFTTADSPDRNYKGQKDRNYGIVERLFGKMPWQKEKGFTISTPDGMDPQSANKLLTGLAKSYDELKKTDPKAATALAKQLANSSMTYEERLTALNTAFKKAGIAVVETSAKVSKATAPTGAGKRMNAKAREAAEEAWQAEYAAADKATKTRMTRDKNRQKKWQEEYDAADTATKRRMTREKNRAAEESQADKAEAKARNRKPRKPAVAVDVTPDTTPDNTPRRGRTAGAVAGISGAMTGLAFAGSMMGGPIGEVANAAMGPMMAISGLAGVMQMIPGPAGIAVGALTGLVAGFFLLKGQLDATREETLKTVEALGNGEKAIKSLAEFTGKVSSGEQMDERRKNESTGYTIQTGKNSTGAMYMQSEQGKALLASVTEAQKKGMDVGALVKSQMTSAISSGAIDVLDAKSIVAELATEMGNTEFGVKINGEISELIGLNGENLLKDPIGVRVRMIEENNRSIMSSDPTTGKNAFGTVSGAALAGVGAAAGIAGIAAAAPPIIAAASAASGLGASLGAAAIAATGVAGPIGLAAVGVAALGVGIWASVDNMNKLESASAANVAVGIMALQNNQEILDSLQLEYEKKIAIAKASGDIAEATRLQSEYEKGRERVLAANAQTMKTMTDQYTKADWAQKGAMGRSLDTAIENQYKDNPLAQQAAIGARDKIVANTADTAAGNANEYQLKLMLASGDADPTTMMALMDLLGSDEKATTATVNFMTNLGTAEGGRLARVMTSFENKDQAATFTANFVTGKAPADTKQYLDLFDEIRKQESAGFKIQAMLEFYNNNPELAKDASADLAALREQAKQGPITVEYIQTLIGAEVGDIIRANQAYFDSLPPDQQVVYTTIIRTLYENRGSADYKDEFRKWYAASGQSGWEDIQGDNYKDMTGRNAELMTQFENQRAESVTKANVAAQQRTAAAVQRDQSKQAGGKTGPEASMLDDLVKKLKQVQMASLDVTKGWEASKAALDNLFPGGASNSPFAGIEQQMRRLGAGEDLITTIAGMNPEEFQKRKDELFTFDGAGNIAGFRGTLLAVGAALRSIALGDFQSKQQKTINTVNDQVSATRKLVAIGYSYADALEITKDAAIASAIAQENNTEIIRQATAEYIKAEQAAKNLAAAQAIAGKNQQVVDQATLVSKLQKDIAAGLLTNAQVQAILEDTNLQTLYLNPDFDPVTFQKALDNAAAKAKVELQTKMLTIEGMEEIFTDGFNKAMEAFSAQEKAIELDFKIKKDPLSAIVKAAQQTIADIQSKPGGLDDLDADLTRISEKERVISESYKARTDALDKIREYNDLIYRQQQGQLSIAEALSQGDIAAAARATQEMRAQQAADAVANQKKLLDAAREAEIAALTGDLGLTREQIESNIRDLKQQIFDIEEQSLEPAQYALELLERQEQVQKDSLTVLGMTKTQWETMRNRIDLAKTSSDLYKQAMEAARDVLVKIIDYWTEIQKPKTTVHTIITKNETGPVAGENWDSSRTDPGYPDTGPGPAPTPTPSNPNALSSSQIATINLDLSRAMDTIRTRERQRADYQSSIWPPFWAKDYGPYDKRINDAKAEAQALRDKIKAGGGIPQYAVGGMVSGGLSDIFKASGTDTIPAMLSPGEFVIRKSAVDSFGASNLESINNGKYSGGSVYNNSYSVTVNAKTGANSDEIARTVIAQIKGVESQRIRGNRF